MRRLSWAKNFEHHTFHHKVANESGNKAGQYTEACSADFIAKLKAEKKSNEAGNAVRYEAPKMNFLFGIQENYQKMQK
jgi:hypothetical protein